MTLDFTMRPEWEELRSRARAVAADGVAQFGRWHDSWINGYSKEFAKVLASGGTRCNVTTTLGHHHVTTLGHHHVSTLGHHHVTTLGHHVTSTLGHQHVTSTLGPIRSIHPTTATTSGREDTTRPGVIVSTQHQSSHQCRRGRTMTQTDIGQWLE